MMFRHCWWWLVYEMVDWTYWFIIFYGVVRIIFCIVSLNSVSVHFWKECFWGSIKEVLLVYKLLCFMVSIGYFSFMSFQVIYICLMGFISVAMVVHDTCSYLSIVCLASSCICKIVIFVINTDFSFVFIRFIVDIGQFYCHVVFVAVWHMTMGIFICRFLNASLFLVT